MKNNMDMEIANVKVETARMGSWSIKYDTISRYYALPDLSYKLDNEWHKLRRNHSLTKYQNLLRPPFQQPRSWPRTDGTR